MGLACLSVVAILLCLAVGNVRAEQTPDQLVKSVATEVLDIVRQDQAIGGNPSRLAKLLEAKVAPHFDFDRMTRLAVGKAWRQATPDQQKALTEQYRALLIRSYAAAYRMQYKDMSVNVKPLQIQPAADDVQVHSQITLPGSAEPIGVSYSMYRSGETWKVYDVAVDGVSLVTTYRSTFAEEIRRGGIDGLVKSLTEKNIQSAVPSGHQ